MKNIITVIMVFLLVGISSAIVDIDVLSVYDRNSDGIIDAEERISLDIDIEECRVDFSESAYADSLASDGTIILTEDIKAVALHHGLKVSEDVTMELVVVPEPVVAVEESIVPVVEEVVVVEEVDDDDSPIAGYYIGVIVAIIIVGVACFVLLGKKDNTDSLTTDVEAESED